MLSTSTVLWRVAVIGLIVAVVPFAVHVYEQRDQVRTDAMLSASVSIRTVSHVTVDQFGDSVWNSGGGSGFLVSGETCEVWTNHHVVADAAIVEVFPSQWRGAAGIPAKVVNSTPQTDIAILKMESCDGLPQATLGDSQAVRAGDITYAVGNPLGRNPDSISRGIISHTHRDVAGGISYLQTDAAINPGNSGGALFNRRGEVIGINTAIARTRGGANVGVGFAIPIDTAKQIVAALRNGPPSWGDAGLSSIVSGLTPDEAAVFLVPDGHAAMVLTESPSDGPSANVLFAHDVIYAIDDTSFTNITDAKRLLNSRTVGDVMHLDLIREGEPRSVEVTLVEGWHEQALPRADHYEGHLGLTVEMWDERDGELGQFRTPIITKVHSLGPAHRAHVASSQHTLMLKGPYMVPYTLDVKTVTGVAFEGRYHAISGVDELERHAEFAFRAGKPLLLEVELWTRASARDSRAPLERKGRAFFKIDPALASKPVEFPGHADLLMAEVYMPAYVE